MLGLNIKASHIKIMIIIDNFFNKFKGIFHSIFINEDKIEFRYLANKYVDAFITDKIC